MQAFYCGVNYSSSFNESEWGDFSVYEDTSGNCHLPAKLRNIKFINLSSRLQYFTNHRYFFKHPQIKTASDHSSIYLYFVIPRNRDLPSEKPIGNWQISSIVPQNWKDTGWFWWAKHKHFTQFHWLSNIKVSRNKLNFQS